MKALLIGELAAKGGLRGFSLKLGIWMIFLANRSGNRTYSGAGAPRGAPTEEGAVALRFLPSCEALFAL